MKSTILLMAFLKKVSFRNYPWHNSDFRQQKICIAVAFIILFSINCSTNSSILKGIDQSRLDFIRQGVSDGENINQVENNLRIPILSYAIRKNSSLEVLKELIQKGADINARDSNGMTPLMVAVESGNLEAVKLLLESGALINEQDKTGRTPLMFSADGEHTNHRNIYTYLLRKRANPYLRDFYGNSVGHYEGRRLKRLRDTVDYLRRINSSYNYGSRGGFSSGRRFFGSSRRKR